MLKEGYFGIKESNLIVIVYYIAASLQGTVYSIQNMQLHVDCDELFGDDTLGKKYNTRPRWFCNDTYLKSAKAQQYKINIRSF